MHALSHTYTHKHSTKFTQKSPTHTKTNKRKYSDTSRHTQTHMEASREKVIVVR